MGYTLGIDLGTTFTAAAVERDGRVEVVPLGNHAATIPSLVFLRDTDEVLIGDAAERRGLQEPWRLARGFKRRFGDTTPILLDRTPFSAERLMALVFRQILDDVTHRQGAAPDSVCVAHPANWGPFKTELLRQATQLGGLHDATYITEPVAAAIHYASTERVEVGDVIAVYDLGGGTFDAAVLRKTPTGFDTLGQPQGIERLGGVDFDEAVFAHVRASVEDAIHQLDPDDVAARAGLARLRQECTLAKEALSSDAEAFVPVMLPTLQTQVRITRAEFEAMIRPTLRETLATLRLAITSSGVPLEEIKTVLLAGGSSRIPMIADMIRSELRLPIAADSHPKHAVALGAARFAAGQRAAPAAATPPPLAAPPPPPPPVAAATAATGAPPAGGPPAAAAATPPAAGSGPPPAFQPPPVAGAGAPRNRRTIGIVAAAVLAVVGIGAALLLFGGDDSGEKATTTSPTGAADTVVDTAVDTVADTAVDTVADTAAPTTAAPTIPPSTTIAPSCGASGRCVGITSIDLAGDRLIVEYQVSGFDPLIGSSASDHHVHFFYDTVGVANGGVPGPGQWALWDRAAGRGELLFDGFLLSTASDFGGAGATALCVAVADFRHVIEQDTAQCVPLGFTIPG